MSIARHTRQMLPAVLAVVALAHQTWDQYVHCQFGWDKVDQLAGAVRLCAGRGLTLEELNTEDLSRPLARPLVGWPPGYSYLAAGMLSVGAGVWQAALAIDVFSAALYLASWYVLAACSRMGLRSRTWLWTFWALAYCPLVRLTSSDQLAAALYSAGLATGAVCVRSGPREPGVAAGFAATPSALLAPILSGVLVGLAGAVRFAYWPLAAVVPLGLLLAGRQNRLLKAGMCAVATGLILGATAWHQHATTGHTTYLTSVYVQPATVWQWRSLRQIHPFPAGALGLDMFWERAHDWLHMPGMARAGTWCLAALVMAAFFAACCRGWQRRRLANWLPVYIYGTGLSTLAITLAMLCWLSVRYPPIGAWTHVQELRYYAPMFGFLTVAWFGSPYQVLAAPARGTQRRLHATGMLQAWQWFWRRACGHNGISTVRRAIALVLAVLVLATMAGGGIWRARRWWRVAAGTTPRPEHSAVFDAEGDFILSHIASLKRQADTVYYIDQRLDRRAMARLAGAVVPFAHELPAQPRTSAPVLIVVPDDQHGETARTILAQWPLTSVHHVAGPGAGLWQYRIEPRTTKAVSSRQSSQ